MGILVESAKVIDQFNGNHLLSFEQVVPKYYNIPRNDLWWFIQIMAEGGCSGFKMNL